MTNSGNETNATNSTPKSIDTNGWPSVNQRRPSRRMAVMLTAFAMSLGSLSGCGASQASASNSESSSESSTTVKSSESDARPESDALYCSGIAGHILDAPTEATATEFRTYWDARRQFEASARFASSGGPVADEWKVVENYTRNVATPFLADHSYEPSVLGDEPADVAAARNEISRYEHDTCRRP